MPSVADTLAPAQRSRSHPWFAAFFAFGAMMSALTLALLLFPGSAFDSIWRLLMLAIGTACLFAAIGLWRGAFWGTRLALMILSVNIVGDIINALFRNDYRALIGLPVGAAMMFFLVRSERSIQRLSHRDKKPIV
jgi:hypothetical protein